MPPTFRIRLIGAVFLLEGVCVSVLIFFCMAALSFDSALLLVLAVILTGILTVALIHIIAGMMCIAGTPAAWPAAIILNTFKLFFFWFSLFLLAQLAPVPFAIGGPRYSLAIMGTMMGLVLLFIVLSPLIITYYIWTVRNTNFLAGPDSLIRATDADPFGHNLLTSSYSRRCVLLTSFLVRRAGAAISSSSQLLSGDRATSFRFNREDGKELAQIARKMTYLPGTELLINDKRPPVIYLRNFFNDGRKVAAAASSPVNQYVSVFQALATNPLMALAGFMLGPLFRSLRGQETKREMNFLNLSDTPSQPDQMEVALSEEEWLGSIFNLKGPFIAIGNPKEKEGKTLRDYGASRIYAGDDWQERVGDMLRYSSLVVFKIDPESEGWGMDPDMEAERKDLINLTWWEIMTASKKVPLDKLIFYLPFHRYKRHKKDYYESICRAMSRHTTIKFPERLSNKMFIELDIQGNGSGISSLSLLRRYYFSGSGLPIRHNPYSLLEWLFVKCRNGFVHLTNAASWSIIVLSLIFFVANLLDAMSPPEVFPVRKQSSGVSTNLIMGFLVICLHLTFFLLIVRWVINRLRSYR